MGHDQLFKDFLRTFFRDFLELFYPDTAERLNFRRLQFLDKEFFTDFPVGDPLVCWRGVPTKTYPDISRRRNEVGAQKGPRFR